MVVVPNLLLRAPLRSGSCRSWLMAWLVIGLWIQPGLACGGGGGGSYRKPPRPDQLQPASGSVKKQVTLPTKTQAGPQGMAGTQHHH